MVRCYSEDCNSVILKCQLFPIYLLISPAGITAPLSLISVVRCWKPSMLETNLGITLQKTC